MSAGSPLVGTGRTLGRYVIDGKVAHGGMGIVWRARQRGAHGFERRVALKTIHPANANDPRYRQMMIDEARVASAIIHPNVVQTLDVGDEEGVLFLVLEWVEGRSVASLHKEALGAERLLPLRQSVELLVAALAGLHAAHEVRGANGESLDVVHRDVSPDNILLTAEGVAKLGDFGVAKAKHRLAQHTGSDEVRGKLRYMAPEQALGGEVDRRADVYAAGAVLRELVSGTLPYDAESDVQQLYMLRNGLTPLPVPETVPEALRTILERATSFDAAARYPTADALRAALVAWQAAWQASEQTPSAALLPAPSRLQEVPQVVGPHPHLQADAQAGAHLQDGGRRGVIVMLILAVACASLGLLFLRPVLRLRSAMARGAPQTSASPSAFGTTPPLLDPAASARAIASSAASVERASASAPAGSAEGPRAAGSAAPARGRAAASSGHGATNASASPSARFNDYGF